jgi:hypothetical protein
MKISSILRDLFARRAGNAEVRGAWADDPYAHPDIDAMSERERADLPPVHMPAPRYGLRGEIPSRLPGNRFATCA